MNPSIELRIRTMQRALTEVVLPAIDPANALAQEQARLLLGHLHALAQQYRDAPRLEVVDAAHLARLARTLRASAAGGPHTRAARDALAALIDADDGADLGMAVEALLVASGVDGDADFRAETTRLTLDHAREAARRGRAWFLPMGFDGDPAGLPDRADILRLDNAQDTP